MKLVPIETCLLLSMLHMVESSLCCPKHEVSASTPSEVSYGEAERQVA